MNVWVKLSLTLVLSTVSVILYAVFRGKARLLCMLAMLLSSLGDCFMIDDHIPLGEYGTYVGAAFFIAAHLVYAECFRRQTKSKGYNVNNGGLIAGISVMILSWAVLSALMCDMSKVTVMYPLVSIYIAVIGYNLCENFAYSFSAKGVNYLNAVGIFVFWISDVFIFLEMLCGYTRLMDYVWYLYPVGQILIILFNSPFKKADKSGKPVAESADDIKQ